MCSFVCICTLYRLLLEPPLRFWVAFLSPPPHSSTLPAVSNAPHSDFFQGFGSNALVVNRLIECSPDNVGAQDATGDPFPCVLRE